MGKAAVAGYVFSAAVVSAMERGTMSSGKVRHSTDYVCSSPADTFALSVNSPATERSSGP